METRFETFGADGAPVLPESAVPREVAIAIEDRRCLDARVVEGSQPTTSPVVELAHANAFRLMSMAIVQSQPCSPH